MLDHRYCYLKISSLRTTFDMRALQSTAHGTAGHKSYIFTAGSKLTSFPHVYAGVENLGHHSSSGADGWGRQTPGSSSDIPNPCRSQPTTNSFPAASSQLARLLCVPLVVCVCVSLCACALVAHTRNDLAYNRSLTHP